jgi:hypothetical protein
VVLKWATDISGSNLLIASLKKGYGSQGIQEWLRKNPT